MPFLSLFIHSRTVANLTRSLDWYTAVLGGVEVQDAGGNGWVGDSVKQLLMQHELLQGSPKADFTAELQDGGTDQLDDEQQVCENCDAEHEDADVPTDEDSAASCS